MNISPWHAGIGGAALVAAAVAFVLRPAQFAPPHAQPEAAALHDSLHTPPAEHVQTLVYVAGAVVHPGVYAVAPEARANDALAKAGGATHDADLVAVNLAAHLTDGEEIVVPRIGDPKPAAASRAGAHRASSSSASRRSHRRPPSRSPDEHVVDLNTADQAALAELPGIGPTLAERIVTFRTLNGPFASVDGLGDVAGITPQRLDALTPRLTVGH